MNPLCRSLLQQLTSAQIALDSAQEVLTDLKDAKLAAEQEFLLTTPGTPAYLQLQQQIAALGGQIVTQTNMVTGLQGAVQEIRQQQINNGCVPGAGQ